MTISRISCQLPLVFDVLRADPRVLLAPPLGFATFTHSFFNNDDEKSVTFTDVVTQEFTGIRFNMGIPVKYRANGIRGVAKTNHFNFIHEPEGMIYERTLGKGLYVELSIQLPQQYLLLYEQYFPVALKTLFDQVALNAPVALSKLYLPIREPLTYTVAGTADIHGCGNFQRYVHRNLSRCIPKWQGISNHPLQFKKNHPQR